MPPENAPSPRFYRLLRALEGYTQTDLVYLASGGSWLALDQIAGGLAAFLLSIAFAHYVSKEAYGTYRFLLAGFWTLTALTMTGLPLAVGQAVARGEEGTYRKALPWSILWSLPFSLGALVWGGYYYFHGAINLARGFICIALIGVFAQAAYLFGSYLAGKKDFRAVAWTGAIFAAIPALALFETMRHTNDPVVLIAVNLASSVLIGVALTIYLLRHYRPNRTVDLGFKSLSRHFSVMGLLSTLSAQVDKLIVFHYLGAIDLAVYSFATALPEQIRGLFGSVSTLAMPKFVERPLQEILKNFWGRLWVFTGSMALVAVVYILLAQFFFSIFFPQYLEAVPYSRLYALALIPIGSALPTTLLQAREAKRELYLLNLFSPTISIAVLIALTAAYGLIGTIIARIVGRAVGLVLGVFFVRSYQKRATSP